MVSNQFQDRLVITNVIFYNKNECKKYIVFFLKLINYELNYLNSSIIATQNLLRKAGSKCGISINDNINLIKLI